MEVDPALEAFRAIRATVNETERDRFDEGVIALLGKESLSSLANNMERHSTPETFEVKLERFLNPEIRLSPEDQLAVMTEFWGSVGMAVPSATGYESRLLAVTSRHPDWRIIPTPLLHVDERVELVEKFKQEHGTEALQDESAGLIVPSEETPEGALLKSGGIIKMNNDGTRLSLLYRDYYTNNYAGRREFADLLSMAQQVLKNEYWVGVHWDTNVLWTFPVIDIRSHVETNEDIEKLYKAINPIVIPETLLTIQLLHRLNGTASTEPSIEVANEAIKVVYGDSPPKPGPLDRVFCVESDLASGRLAIVAVPPGEVDGQYVFRGAESGLSR